MTTLEKLKTNQEKTDEGCPQFHAEKLDIKTISLGT